MKKALVIVFLLVTSLGFSQAPQFFKYQAIVRNNGGLIVSNQTIPVKVSILKGTTTGAVVYSESHAPLSNVSGSINLDIGRGTGAVGTFNTIAWGADLYFVKVEMDVNNDNTFEHVGTTQLLSVPYALYANKSGDEKWNTTNNTDIFYTKGKVGIGTNAPEETLHLNGNIRGNQSGALRISTANGYIDVGSKNPDYAHFYTDRPYGFYFGGAVTAREHVIGYHESDLHLSTQSGTTYQPVKRISILNSNGYVGINKTNPQYLLDVNGALNATSILVNGVPVSPASPSGWSTSGNNLYSTNAGNVGIGISTPVEKLHINGNLRGNQQSGTVRVKSDHGYVDIGPKNADYAHFYTDRPYGFYFGGSVTAREHVIGYHESDLHLSTQSSSTYQPVKRISIMNSTGFVGINTTEPQYLLDVNGTLNATSILLDGVPLTNTPSSTGWAATGNDIYTNNSGNVGIGVSTPLEKLHINGNLRGNQQSGTVRVKSDHGYIDIGPKNADYGHFYTDRPYGFYFGGKVTVRDHLVGYHEGDLHLSTQSPSTYQPVKRISIMNSTGYVGIGTDQPKTQLQVESGDIYLSSVTSGVIMKSPDNQCWKMTVNNSGQPVFTSVPCPQ